MLWNLSPFLLDVIDHWIFWIGLVLMVEPYLEHAFPALAAVLRRYIAEQGRKKVFRTLGLLALFFACFQAWNTQYEVAGQSRDRLAMKALIARAIGEADTLQLNWWQRSDDDQFTHEANLWINKVGHLIDAYGVGEASAWNNDAGITNYSDGKKHTELHNAIMNRTARLKELIPRVDTLRMRQGFDPSDYHWVEKCDAC